LCIISYLFLNILYCRNQISVLSGTKCRRFSITRFLIIFLDTSTCNKTKMKLQISKPLKKVCNSYINSIVLFAYQKIQAAIATHCFQTKYLHTQYNQTQALSTQRWLLSNCTERSTPKKSGIRTTYDFTILIFQHVI